MCAIDTQLFKTLVEQRNSMLSPNIDHDQHTAPAVTVFNILNGCTSIHIPSLEAWILAYADNPECKLVMEFIDNLSNIKNRNLQYVHHHISQPLRQPTLIRDDPYFFLREHTNDVTYIKFYFVPFTCACQYI